MLRKLKEVRQGEPITAKAWNELVAEVARLSSMAVAAPLELVRGAGAPLLRLGYTRGPVVYGKLTSSLTRGTLATPQSATVRIWHPDGVVAGKLVETDETRTVYDTGFMLSSLSPIAVDTFIRMHELGPYLYYDDHNCEDELE